MKKFIAMLALVAFTAATAAYAGEGCGKCPGEKKDCDKAKTEGKCPAGGEKKDEKKS